MILVQLDIIKVISVGIHVSTALKNLNYLMTHFFQNMYWIKCMATLAQVVKLQSSCVAWPLKPTFCVSLCYQSERTRNTDSARAVQGILVWVHCYFSVQIFGRCFFAPHQI